MIYVGLSGNRFSGKNRVCKLFGQIGIPVFDADTVLRFALHYNVELLRKVKVIYPEYFGEDDYNLDLKKVKNENAFGQILSLFKIDIFDAYKRFNKKNYKSIYTIFHSSILFESGWDKEMDQNISVFSPSNERMERCKYLTDYKISDIYKLTQSEMGDLKKNNQSTYVIHNYDAIGNDVLNNVCKVDKKIIDYYLYNNMTEIDEEE